MPDKEEIKTAYEEFRALLAGGQNNREFYLSARVVCEFFDQLLREQPQPPSSTAADSE